MQRKLLVHDGRILPLKAEAKFSHEPTNTMEVPKDEKDMDLESGYVELIEQ